MIVDAALIQSCADPSLKPAIVEQFLKAAGSPNPLAVTVRSGSSVVLIAPPKTAEEALALTRKYVGEAVVRVGITQYPAGLGISDPAQLSPGVFDACKNLKVGTGLFGKVWRIVWQWYGNPTEDSVLPEVLRDAVDAWNSGTFEGKSVFSEPDPGEPKDVPHRREERAGAVTDVPASFAKVSSPDDPNKAGTRIDLSGIVGRAQ
jgi:hypothetical protein